MHDSKPTLKLYLRLLDPPHHFHCIRSLLSKPSFPALRQVSHSPFAVAQRLLTDYDPVSERIATREKIACSLVQDRITTARLMANPGRHRLKRRKHTDSESISPKPTLREVMSTKGYLPRTRSCRCSKRLTRLNSLIAVCGQESDKNQSYRQEISASQAERRERFRRFRGSLEVLEGLKEHSPVLVEKLYRRREKEEACNRVDSFVMSHRGDVATAVGVTLL